MMIHDRALLDPHRYDPDCVTKTPYRDCGVICHHSEYIRRPDGFYDAVQCDSDDPDDPIHRP